VSFSAWIADHRLLGAHGGRHRHLTVNRHVAPAEQHLAFGAHRPLQLLLARQPGRVFLRQEDHADAVFAGRRQLHAQRGHLGAVVIIRDLDQDAGAVAHQLVGAHRTAVVQVLQNLQALLNDRMRALTFDVRDKPHAAGIVLELRPVEALLRNLRRRLCRSPFTVIGHSDAPSLAVKPPQIRRLFDLAQV
jgi:hypothetical protein